MNRPANAKRPVLFYFEHSRPFQFLSCLHLEWKLIVLKFLLSLFHLATVNWEFEASSHKVIVLLFLFIFTFRHFLAPRRNDLISYSFKNGFYSLFCFDFSVFCLLLWPWANFGHLEFILFYQEFISLRLKIIWGAVSRFCCVMKVFSLTVGDFNSTPMIHYKLYF